MNVSIHAQAACQFLGCVILLPVSGTLHMPFLLPGTLLPLFPGVVTHVFLLFSCQFNAASSEKLP